MVFGLWGKKKAPKLVDELDEVYVKRTLADAALVRAAREADLPLIVASFFSKSLARIEPLLAAQPGLRCERIVGRRWPSGAFAKGSCLLLDASEVTEATGFDTWLLGASSPFSFLFVEHFPRWSTERALLDILELGSATHAQRVRFFLGLDEPLMRAFDGEKVANLMRKLGLAEDEKITHGLIDKSIVNAQKKIDERAGASSPAASDEEWFALNLQ